MEANTPNTNAAADAAADRAANVDSAIWSRMAEAGALAPRVSPTVTPLSRPETIAETGARLAREDAAKKAAGQPAAQPRASADASAQKVEQEQQGEQSQENQNQQPVEGHTLDAPYRGSSPAEDWGADVSSFGGVAAGAGISKAVAQTLVDHVSNEVPKNSPLMSGGTWNQEKVRADLHSSWGADYESQMESVCKAVRAGGAKLENWLDDTGSGNNPAVIRTLAALGRDPNFLDASKAQGRIDKIMNDPKSPYWQGNKQAVFEMSLLFALAAQQR